MNTPLTDNNNQPMGVKFYPVRQAIQNLVASFATNTITEPVFQNPSARGVSPFGNVGLDGSVTPFSHPRTIVAQPCCHTHPPSADNLAGGFGSRSFFFQGGA